MQLFNCLFFFLFDSFLFTFYGQWAFIGVNIGSDMPRPATRVVELLQEHHIQNVRLLSADKDMLLALANTGITVTISITNEEMFRSLLSDTSARAWVNQNVVDHYPATNIIAIAVGSDIRTVFSYAAPYLVSFLKTIHDALVATNLHRQIKVSMPIPSSLILDSFPPSQAFFNRSWDPVLVPMLKFLQQTGSHLMLNVYPYYDYIQSKNAISLDYALFRSLPPNSEAIDPNTHLHYTNVFDSVVDAAYSAMAYLNITNVPIVVTESGWPSKGDASEPDATLENANTYNSNLIRHVLNNTGTPMHPRVAVSTYLYELYNEDTRPGSVSDRNWGLFDKNGVPIYIMRITGSGILLATDTVNKTFCVAKEDADQKMLLAALDWTCGQGKVDCAVLREGQPCFEPNTVAAHASYAFSAYCHENGIDHVTCNFNGVATITTTDPSYGTCLYPGSINSALTNGSHGTNTRGDHSLGAMFNPNVLFSVILLSGSLVLLSY
ncbi:hypothetical protein MKW92_001243 [Papaver armeniacum]|nr:hypothetical protein MKW92_001243 [Papaver armeniacum]